MTYIAPADFRAATLASYCQDIALTTADISDANLTALIAEKARAFDNWVSDHFEPEPGLTLKVNGRGGRYLYVSKRIRALTSVTINDPYGIGSPVLQSTYYDFDVFAGTADQVKMMNLISMTPSSPYYWPRGRRNVTIVGDFSWPSVPDDVKRAVALACWERVQIDNSSAIEGPPIPYHFSRLVEAQSIAEFYLVDPAEAT